MTKKKSDPKARRNRITTLWSDADYAKIKRLAARENVALAAVVFDMARPALRRRR